MAMDEAEERSWAELCAAHEHAVSELKVAMLVVQTKMAAGVEPTLEDLVRLQNAHVARQEIARQMQDASTRRD